MHTARSLDERMFNIEIEGRCAQRTHLFEGAPEDRLGVVVTSPLGALGASFLIQLATTAYFDCAEKRRRESPHYAEVYAFHVNGRFGDLSPFDFWPPRKEVFVEGSGVEVLREINARAITHLAVPDGPLQNLIHSYKEPEAARDRIKRCFAYDPSGRATGGDIAISCSAKGALADIDAVMDPDATFAVLDAAPPTDDPVEQADREWFLASFRARAREVDAEAFATARRRRDALLADGVVTETYRSIDLAKALLRLGSDS